MTTLTGKYITLETLFKNYFEDVEFAEYMKEFGKSTRNNFKLSVIEIIEDESGEVVDYAHAVCITFKGQKFYDVQLSEMNSFWNLNGEHFDTEFDELELSNDPINYQRCNR